MPLQACVGPKALKMRKERSLQRARANPRVKGAGVFDFLDPHKNGVAEAFNHARAGVEDAYNKTKNEFTNPDSVLARGAKDAAEKVGHEFTDPDSMLRGEIVPMAGDIASFIPPAVPILGQIATGVRAVSKVNDVAKALGYGKPDSIAERRAIVSKVMKERGLSLPEASKYVKTHGLWRR